MLSPRTISENQTEVLFSGLLEITVKLRHRQDQAKCASAAALTFKLAGHGLGAATPSYSLLIHGQRNPVPVTPKDPCRARIHACLCLTPQALVKIDHDLSRHYRDFQDPLGHC